MMMKKFLLPIVLVLLTSCSTKKSPDTTARLSEASPSTVAPSFEASPTLTPLPTASPTDLIPTPNTSPITLQPTPNIPITSQPSPSQVAVNPQIQQCLKTNSCTSPAANQAFNQQQQPSIAPNYSPYSQNKGSIGQLQQSPSIQLVSQTLTPQPGHLPPKQYIPHLPKSQLTPGAVYENATKETICTPGYSQAVSKTVAYVPPDQKKQVYNAYGIKNYKSGKYAIDHLISPDLGGSNDVSNLWVEPYHGEWNVHQKDKVESELHHRVCSGKIPLTEAQHEIATDWIAAYKRYVGKSRE